MAEHDDTKGGTHEDDELKVTDRRLFTTDGQLRSVVNDEAESEVAEDPPQPDTDAPRAPDFEHRPVEEPSGVDFGLLINAMAEPALLFLGEIGPADSKERIVDLGRARLQIDMLDLLRTKCRGNLTAEEDSLIDKILYQLRMLYVAKANQPET